MQKNFITMFPVYIEYYQRFYLLNGFSILILQTKNFDPFSLYVTQERNLSSILLVDFPHSFLMTYLLNLPYLPMNGVRCSYVCHSSLIRMLLLSQLFPSRMCLFLPDYIVPMRKINECEWKIILDRNVDCLRLDGSGFRYWIFV